MTRTEQSLKSGGSLWFWFMILECFSMVLWYSLHPCVIPNQGYVHSTPSKALQHRSENVDLVIEFERSLWWEHKPDARMFMALLLCGQQCTQPLSLAAAKFSMLSASLWSKTSWVMYRNEHGVRTDMHQVHELLCCVGCWQRTHVQLLHLFKCVIFYRQIKGKSE